MWSLLVLTSLVSLAAAQPPVWYPDGPCGISKYSDAGNMPIPAGKMIVGGQQAREYEFPYQASMRTQLTDSHFCGGLIMNKQWIMTAAHCMVGEAPATLNVAVGEHDRSDTSSLVRQLHKTDAIIIHEDYSARSYANDIALVKLAAPGITFNDDIQPICAPDPTDLHVHVKTVVSGWGTMQSGGVCCPNILRYVSLNMTTNTYCDTAYPRDDITDDMICATDNSDSTLGDACQVDSGGPLAVWNDQGSFTAAGVVSWGIGCASGYPGVYARVGYFHQWILDHINAN